MDIEDDPFVASETETHTVDARQIQSIAQAVCKTLGVAYDELSIRLVDAQEIQRLNRDFRGKDRPTDVLSFPQRTWLTPPTTENPNRDGTVREDAPPQPLGDIVISLPAAASNAENIGQGLDREVAFLIVHGILHLCGHDHQTPEEEAHMTAQQQALMALLSDHPEGPLWSGCVRPAGAGAVC